MLFGHRWLDETCPHNLLADWSQEEEEKKKQHIYRDMDEKKTAHMGTEIIMYKLMCNYIAFLYSGQPFQTSTQVHKDAVK